MNLNSSRNRQEVKRLLNEFLKHLRGLLIQSSSDITMEEFMRIESKRGKYNQSMKGSYETQF